MSEEVRSMFAQISGNYDTMNTIISFGMHHGWRRKAVQYSGAHKGNTILDCASGTGDLALEFKKVVGENGVVVATDFCQEMLDYIQPKAQKTNLPVTVELADVMQLQYPTAHFDITSISFGIRNVDNPVQGLSEMARVVKPGGKVVVIETGQPQGINLALFKIYSSVVLPMLGLLFAGNKSAYTYLPKTAAAFPYGAAFVELMNQTKRLHNIQVYPQAFGSAYIYVATVI